MSDGEPMHPSAERIGAWVDGELDAGDTREVASHLEDCVACRRRADLVRATSVKLRRDAPAYRASDTLRARVGRMASPRRTPVSTWSPRIAAGLAIAVLSSAATYLVMSRVRSALATAPGDVVARHIAALAAPRLVNVASNDQHNVKPWFDGKVPFSPDVPRLDSAGFPLIGGRVDTIAGRAVAAIVYGRRKHVIEVFVWPVDSGGATPAAESVQRGYQVVQWVHGDLRYAAVSDVAADDLRTFRQLWPRGSMSPHD